MMFLVHPLIISLFMGSTLKIIFSFKSTCIFVREHEKGSTEQRTVLCKKNGKARYVSEHDATSIKF